LLCPRSLERQLGRRSVQDGGRFFEVTQVPGRLLHRTCVSGRFPWLAGPPKAGRTSDRTAFPDPGWSFAETGNQPARLSVRTGIRRGFAERPQRSHQRPVAKRRDAAGRPIASRSGVNRRSEHCGKRQTQGPRHCAPHSRIFINIINITRYSMRPARHHPLAPDRVLAPAAPHPLLTDR
jgi:hypothetical protein